MNYPHVYLASASPRRRELLQQVGIQYTVIIPNVDESQQNDPDPKAYTERIAAAKAASARQQIKAEKSPDRPIIAADTAVTIDNAILGKPRNYDDSARMLRLLSNRTHQVYSSICIINGAERHLATQISEVTFRTLSQQEIKDYWQTGEPQDKAGAYAIQGLAAGFISHLSGSYSAVMGLPLYEVLQFLGKKDAIL